MAEARCLHEGACGESEVRVERRKAVRFACLTECFVRLEGAARDGSWPGMAYNISATGIAVALPFPALLGTVLEIERRSLRGGGRSLRARVVRCRLERCVWFHGCAFEERLSDLELQTWLPLPLEARID
jgi:hypothetical protein